MSKSRSSTMIRVPLAIKAEVEQVITAYRQLCQSVRDQAADEAIAEAHPQIKQELRESLRQLVGVNSAAT